MSWHQRVTPPAEARAEMILAEGFCSEIFNALTTGTFLTGLARLLGAEAMGLAFLTAVPFLAQLTQCAAPWLVRRVGSYQRLVVAGAWGARLLWLLPALLPILDFHSRAVMEVAMGAVFFMTGMGMIVTHCWTAWLAEMVPANRRTHLFGQRIGAVTLGTLVATLCGALILDHARHVGHLALGYVVLGIAAVTAGWSGVGCMRQFPDGAPPQDGPTLRSFVQTLGQRPRFVRMIGFFSLWGFAVGIPAPFWSLCMLENLQMSFLLICCHDALVLLVRLLCNRWWIALLQRVGTRRVLVGCAVLISINPLLWLLMRPDRLWPIWVEAVWSGVLWTGFNQAAFIAPLVALPAAERSHGLAVFNVATGTAQFAASICGGIIMQVIGISGFKGFAVLFVLSSALRFVTAFIALRRTESMGIVAFVRQGATVGWQGAVDGWGRWPVQVKAALRRAF